MARRRYPTDLTDRQWALVAPHVPAAKPGGRPRSADEREVVDAILYVLRNGVVWRALSHDFPPWSTVYSSSAHGAGTGPGGASTTRSATGCGGGTGGSRARARRSWTARR